MTLVSSEGSRPDGVPKESKISRPSKHLRAINEFSRKHANYTVRIVVGLGKVVDRVLTVTVMLVTS